MSRPSKPLHSPPKHYPNITGSSMVNNGSSTSLYSSERRKARKLYLDSKKNNNNIHNTDDKENPYPRNQSIFPTPSPTSLCYNPEYNSCLKSSNTVNILGGNCTTPLQNSNIPSTSNNKKASSSKQLSKRITSNVTKDIPTSSNQAQKISKRSRIFTPIRMAPLTDEQLPIVQVSNVDQFLPISKDYLDHGDQTFTCFFCNAKLWKDEAMRGKNSKGKTGYSLCCRYGKVLLPDIKEPPEELKRLFLCQDAESKFFMKNVRRFNSMFSFTSMGGQVFNSVNQGRGPSMFRLSGQNYHSIGALLPQSGSTPKFSQLYIYDTENEIHNRQNVLGSSNKGSTVADKKLDLKMIKHLTDVLDSVNELVKCYRTARDCWTENPNVDIKLRLIAKRDKDGRQYNLPSSSEVAALIVGDDNGFFEKRDIIVKKQSGGLENISELHPLYLALQYPLLFPYGEDGYRVDIPHRNVERTKKKKQKFVTMREYFAYKIQDRLTYFSSIINSKRLFQQFLVDSYCMIESERLFYIRRQQTVLRCESYETLHNRKSEGHTDVSNVGQRVILPSSFTGGARYMLQNYLDAMALCKYFGNPDLFITFTCNPKWPEIKRYLKDSTLNPDDRPDILCRLFKIKLDSLIKDLKDKNLLGKTEAVVYTVEFQKRGLPHAHICLFLHADYKMPTVEQIDPVISAEIPDKNDDPELYSLVSEFMIHGPCGPNHLNSPCMIDGKCSKKFPRKFEDNTRIDSKGFPIYRRRDTGHFVEKSREKIDNRNVVPYNKTLLKRYQGHINVEWCNQASSIKYLFKYINKGPDRASIALENTNDSADKSEQVDEIKTYYKCRYVSSCEAAWRIFGYDVHYRTPPVTRLPFHLPGQQQIMYDADDDIDKVLNKPSVASSMFEDWMKCNQTNTEAQGLTYAQFPSKFVYITTDRCWQLRKRKTFSIGRIHSVPPSIGEGYFLRILLNKVKGPKSYEDIRTVNGKLYPTFGDACYALGLLDDDKEYVEALKEASHSGTGYYMRNLFATMLFCNTLSRPEYVWEQTWKLLSDDIERRQRKKLNIPDLDLNEEQIKNLALLDIEEILMRNNKSLKDFTRMPYPNSESISSANNSLMNEELCYDSAVLSDELQDLQSSLTNEQKHVFEVIMSAVSNNKGGVFFLYGYGGTGKTFLWKTLSAAIRSKGQIVLNVASSGIASLLLSGGRTAHSRFKIPINVTEMSLCNIRPGSDLSNLVKKAQLIIWDEAPMTHKHSFEALDKSLRDVFKPAHSNQHHLPFGGKVIVFGGDFRQILPVVPNGSRQDIVDASISSSNIWSHCKLLTLTKNMRLTLGATNSDAERTSVFAKWLLDLGEGKIGDSNDGDAQIVIPEDLLIKSSNNSLNSLIDFVYPQILQRYHEPLYFQERAILTPKNEVVHEINDHLLAMFPGEEKEFLSCDSVCPSDDDYALNQHLYSSEVLNGLSFSGMPKHRLVLKIGVPVMLLRNIDQKNGLCNGTRLQIKALGTRVIEAEIISGNNIGTRTFIPRLKLSPSDNRIAVKIQRRQFPISVCFAMTINKSQGQSLSRVGLYLKDPVFTHGQLYVALSRVKSRDGLKILILDNDGKATNKTSNVVYKEIFTNL